MEYTKEFKRVKSEMVVNDRVVTGLAAVMGNVDLGSDVIWPGAFSKTLQERRPNILHLWQHDSYSPPIAKIIEIREIAAADLPSRVKEEFPEATGGLEVSREYLNTPRGNEVLEGIKAGAISEMSIGYDAIKVDFDENDDGAKIRNLRELRLWDTSDVTWGMNPATVAAKAFARGNLDLVIALLEQLKTEDLSESQLQKIAGSVELLQSMYNENAGAVNAARNTDNNEKAQYNITTEEKIEALKIRIRLASQMCD